MRPLFLSSLKKDRLGYDDLKQLREGLRGVSNSLKPDRSVLTFSRSLISGLQVAFNEKVGIINEKKVGKIRTTC